MKAVNPKGTYEYVCKCDRDLPKDEQSVFVLSYLTAEQQSKLDDSLGYQGENGFYLTMGASNLLALHLGLVDIKNFSDEQGNQITLKRDQTKAKNSLPGVGRPWEMDGINQIAKNEMSEVAQIIKDGGELTEEEAKNS